MGEELPLSGTCPDEFATVRDAFVANFTDRGEVGGAVCVLIDGEVVVDLVGGWRDAARTQPWRDDTLVNIYSAGKGVLATLALQLIEKGQLALDGRVGRIWEDYRCHGKEDTLVRHALCDLAGVPAIREPLTNDDLWDWERMTGAIRGDRGLVRAGHPGRLPHEHLRPSGRRDRPAGRRLIACPLRCASWRRRSVRTSGIRWRRKSNPAAPR